MRSFARDLSIDPSTLRQIMAGSRNLSMKKIQKLLDRFTISLVEKNVLMGLSATDGVALRDGDFKDASNFDQNLIANWLCYPVLSAFYLKDFESDEKWFASRFNVGIEAVGDVLRLLEGAGLIDRTKMPWSCTKVRITASKGNQTEQLRIVHGEYLQKALDMIEDDRRVSSLSFMSKELNENVTADFSGLVFPMKKDRLHEAFERIKVFRRNLAEFLCENSEDPVADGDEVYRLGIQLFPVSVFEKG